MAKKRRPLWEQQKPPKMLLCHMMDSELTALDQLQGGPSEDPQTGFREYSKLAPLFDNPKVQQIFKTVSDEIHKHGKLSPQMQRLYKFGKQMQAPFVPTTPETQSPIKEIEKTSRAPDKRLAWLPENICEFFIDMNGHFSTNPETGLLEFGFLGKVFKPVTKVVDAVTGGRGNEIIRTGATVLGAVLGGPAGMGVGNALGHMATGNDFGNAAMSGLKNFGLGAAASGIGSMMGAPAMGGMFGGQGLGLTGMAAGMLGSSGAATGATAGSAEANLLNEARKAAGVGGTGAASGLGGMLGNVSGALTPFMLSKLASDALAVSADAQHHRNSKKDWSHLKKEEEERREAMGFNRKFERLPARKWVKNPNSHWGPNAELVGGPMYLDVPEDYVETEHHAHGGQVESHPTGHHYHEEGFLVEGPGDGQADKIKTSVPEGTYIIDASSVADFGNGSSQAGAKVLKKFQDKLLKQYSKLDSFKEGGTLSRPVPVWLSKDEVQLDPRAVTALGGGSNKEGSYLLKQMVKNLRKHKNSNGDKLPPKAKDPFSYIERRI